VEQRAAALARLFENAHEGVYVGSVGPEGSSTVAANAHLKRIFGYAGEIPDDQILPFAPERFDDPQARRTFLDRLSADGTVTDYLLRLRQADGNTFWAETTARAEAAGPDGTLRVEALVRDVSQRKRLDDEARGVFQQLLQAEKMAALGQTISGVAHELNNPLATILSWAERLSQRSVKADDPARRGLETILREAERAARIVRTLLTFARKRQTTRAMVDVNQVVRETMALRSYEQQVSNVHVVSALAAGLPQVFADGHQLQQVLLNLVINAEQAMVSSHGRGTLVLRTWYDAERESVVLEINDDGPGIPEDVQPRIFDPFFTTKEVGKGTGLGLTVACAIVAEHGGQIRLESRQNAGASFFVELPVSGAAPVNQPSDQARLRQREASRTGASILVVEDETGLAAAVIDALKDAGYAVEHAADGEQALGAVKSRSFDLVVCDLKMPRLDGKEFYTALSAARPRLARRVIFVTGDVAAAGSGRFLEESGCRWLAKPFRLADLLRAVNEGLA
jgi:PAS domain S-box-containing protein